MTVTVRFAPSPTGYIHIGNARTALFNWLFALKQDGRFLLRYDDTDRERSTAAFARQIATDLDWLGIRPHAVARQSDRLDRHDAVLSALKAQGLLYPCYETPEELDIRRKLRAQRKLPPVYGRESLRLSEAERLRLEAEGRRPHWRFLLPNFADDPLAPRRTEIRWDDLVRGPQTVDLASISDPVLVREDGTHLYTPTSVIDDIDLGITHVIRGDDHVTNTGVQIALFRALGAEPPVFGHHNLLTAASGEGLSKRTGALSIRSLAEAGYEPMAVASLAVLIGTSRSVRAVADMDELAGLFDIAATSHSASKFDPAELVTLNRELVHGLAFDAVAPRLSAMGIDGPAAERFWLAVRGNLDRVSDAAHWWRVIMDGPDGSASLSQTERDYVRGAMELLPPEPWHDQTWSEWTNAVKAATGRKGRDLFHPLRLALTGADKGPELAGLLPLLGRDRTLARRP